MKKWKPFFKVWRTRRLFRKEIRSFYVLGVWKHVFVLSSIKYMETANVTVRSSHVSFIWKSLNANSWNRVLNNNNKKKLPTGLSIFCRAVIPRNVLQLYCCWARIFLYFIFLRTKNGFDDERSGNGTVLRIIYGSPILGTQRFIYTL